MEAVDVLFGRDGGDDEFGGEVLRKRKLHEDAVHGVVMVQSVDDGEEFGFGRFGGHADFIRADARALAGADLVADVDLAGGSSPTRTTASPGRCPCSVHASTRVLSSSWMRAASALPSMILTVIKKPPVHS